ncbi:MAG: GNAT family N-acetyltransferase [Mariprofundaceae bacterium]
MSAAVEFLLNKASAAEIAEHLLRCDVDFVAALIARVKIEDYAEKIATKAIRFEAWIGGTLVGMVAVYCNDQEHRIAYITNVSVLREWMGKGIAGRLVAQCTEHAKASGMRQVSLEVASDNAPAIKLYEKSGFIVGKANVPFVSMNLVFERHERA